jgi:polyisoprenoid-binding protein YceI
MMSRAWRLSILALVLLGAGSASAATWHADTRHSVLSFKIRHLFSKTSGRFEDWSATLNFDPGKIEEGSVKVEIQAASVNTDNERRDADLRSPNFFDVEKYPSLSFTSTKISKGENGYVLHGKLTIRGVTKEISFPFAFDGAGPDPWGGTRAGFSATLSIDRKDFGIVWNKTMDQGGLMLGDTVDIDIELEAVEDKD